MSMSAGSPAIKTTASVAFIGIKFQAKINLTVLDAFISAVSPMLCDPVVHVYSVSKETGAKTRVGQTSVKLFTAYPVWKESLVLTIEDPSDTVLEVEMRDGTNQSFLGTAALPIELASDSATAEPKRLMLLPRCALKSLSGPDPREDPDNDLKHLQQFGCDDFGHLSASWEVQLEPVGGVTHLGTEKPALPQALPPTTYLSIVSQWLVPGKLSHPGTVFRALASFETGAESPSTQEGPALIPLDNGVHCTNVIDGTKVKALTVVLQRRNPTDINVDELRLPACALPTLLDRTVYWTLPASSKHRPGQSWGAVVLQLRASATSPTLGAASQYTGTTSKQPDCLTTPAGPILWESDEHVARSTERRWRRSCVVEAKPTPSHLRHLLDVLLKRASLDPSMNQVVQGFYNNVPQELIDWRQLIISLTFAAPEVNIPEACRFAFAVMRNEAERAIRLDDVVFVLENCLLPLSLDLTAAEIRKRVSDLFVDPNADANPFVPFPDFMATVSKQYSFWCALGVSLDDRGPSKADEGGLATGAEDATEDPWRHITMRVIKTGRAFSVTAHAKDSLERVKAMVQATVGITAGRQQYTFCGQVLADNALSVGAAFPQCKIDQGQEVSVTEVDEVITIIFVHRGQHKKWEQRMIATDKVLKLRGLIQQKTMIPLSRLHLSHASQTMWDRHALDHYQMVDGSVVEVTEKH